MWDAFSNTSAAMKCYICNIYFEYISHLWHTYNVYIKISIMHTRHLSLVSYIQLFSYALLAKIKFDPMIPPIISLSS